MAGDRLDVLLIAAGWTAGVGLVGLLLAYATRRQSLRWLITLVALIAVLAVTAGVLGTANAMFLSQHDFEVVLLVCLIAGVVAVLFALGIGASVARWSRAMHDGARRFGESGEYVAASGGPAELHNLSAELARTSERLGESREREQLLEASRRELVAWVSHDLRSPLAGLRAMTEALEDGLADDPARYYRRMRSEVDRIVRMVDDLFELSRIQSGVVQLSVQRVALGDIVSEAIAAADPVARAAGVRLGGCVDDGAMVEADPNGLSRIVANLVMNAIRHTPADGAVSITGRVVPEGVELSVADACGGIPEDELPRVFDLAWRGGPARTPETDRSHGTGAGLGLAIVKGIVEAHHGIVQVVNEAPGCRFLVRLPAAAQLT